MLKIVVMKNELIMKKLTKQLLGYKNSLISPNCLKISFYDEFTELWETNEVLFVLIYWMMGLVTRLYKNFGDIY